MLLPTTRFRDLPVQDLDGVTRNFEQLGSALESVETKIYTNVKEFGATGNGGGDDTAAIASAIKAAGENGAVFLPPGEYLVSKALSIPYPHFTLRGAGYRSSVLKLANSSNSAVITTPDDAVQRNNLLLQDFGIYGNAANQAGEEPTINIRGMNEARLEGLYLLEPRGPAIKFGQATGGIFNTVPMIHRCVIRGDKVNSQSNGIALESGSSDAQVIGCDIGFFTKGAGILISGHAGYELIGNQCWQNKNGYQIFQGSRGRLIGCLSDLAKEHGIVIQNANDTQLIGCQSRESGQTKSNEFDGILLEGTEEAKECKNTVIVGCRAMGATTRHGLNIHQFASDTVVDACDFRETVEGNFVEGTTGVLRTNGGVWKKLSSLTYKNSWEDFEVGARKGEYRKNSLGNVELRGTIKGGAAGTEVVTLPTGYRPVSEEVIPMIDSGGLGYVSIASTGVVKVEQITGEVKPLARLNSEFSVE